MTQGTASFKYEVEKNSTGMTGVAGIPMYMDLIERIGLGKIIEEKRAFFMARQAFFQTKCPVKSQKNLTSNKAVDFGLVIYLVFCHYTPKLRPVLIIEH